MRILNRLLVNKTTIKLVSKLDEKPSLWFRLRPILLPIVSMVTFSNTDSDELKADKLFISTLGQL